MDEAEKVLVSDPPHGCQRALSKCGSDVTLPCFFKSFYGSWWLQEGIPTLVWSTELFRTWATHTFLITGTRSRLLTDPRALSQPHAVRMATSASSGLGH